MDHYHHARPISRAFFLLLSALACTCGAYIAMRVVHHLMAAQLITGVQGWYERQPLLPEQLFSIWMPMPLLYVVCDILMLLVASAVVTGLVRRPVLVIHRYHWDDDC